ncbi:MAG: mechanosensitive ion channel family protein [Gammaproteobacteria bacterium]|nr:mechanosensitive ion channel family protein [Gammaproteobacteria bacterium]
MSDPNSLTRWLPRRALLASALALLLVAGGAGAAAPAPGDAASAGAEVTLPEDLTREEVRALLSRLSDEQVRDLLMRELDRNAAPARQARPSYLDRINAGMERLRDTLGAALASWPELPGLPLAIWEVITAGGVHSSLAVVLGLLLSLACAIAVELIARRLLAGARASDTRMADAAGALRFGVAAVWLLRELLLIALFVLVAVGASWLALLERESAEPLYATAIGFVAILRVVAVLVDAVVSSRDAARRLVPIGDAGARALERAAVVVTGLLLINQAARSLSDAYSVSPGAGQLVGVISSFLVVLALAGFLWYGREGFARVILGDVEHAGPGDAAFRRTLAASWPGLSIAYVFGVWMIAIMVAFATGVRVLFPALASFALVLALPVADAGLRRLVGSTFAPAKRTARTELSVGADGSVAETHRDPVQGGDYRWLILRYLRILMLILVVFCFLSLWNIELDTLAESILGNRVAGALFDIGLTVLLAYAVWGVVKAAVEYHVGPEPDQDDEAHPEGEAGGPGASRLQTLLPLFRKFILITLVVIAVLISLSALGVNIGPLVAGAGIVGIAIGFGAQTLVRDIVSGVFFLIDDAFRMGEYVEIDNIRGSVEAISVRSLRLRHHNGPLHTVPFGEIKHLTNYSRDWAIMKFELRVPFETDLDKVRKIIKRIGQEMLDDEELGPLMLSPLKSQGVNRMDDSALILRCKFTALPGQQFYVRREAFTRIQKAFDEAGIHFAPRRVIVEAPTPALAQAAAGAIDQRDAKEEQPKSDDRG